MGNGPFEDVMSYIKWFFLCIAVMLGYRSFMWTKHDSDDTVEGSEIQPSLPLLI